jgi:hypothetical protein
MHRFVRYKALQAMWYRARTLLASLLVPRHQEQRARAHRWQQVEVAERQLMDGVVRGSGDPDSAMRPLHADRRAAEYQAWHAQHEAQRAWQERQQAETQRQQRQSQERRGR